MSPLTVTAWALAAVVVTLATVVIGAVAYGVIDFTRRARREYDAPQQSTQHQIYTSTQEDQ